MDTSAAARARNPAVARTLDEASFTVVPSPPDLLERALRLQRDLAHHHGMWHRTPIPDLLIAETALANDLGVIHVDRDFDRIAEVRPLVARKAR